MALAEFWNNVWERNPLARGNLQTPDVPRVTAEELGTALAAKSGFDPRAVAGYDPADFDFLPDADREQLTALVTEYRSAATELASADRKRDPVSLSESRRNELRKQAADALRGVILLLQQDRYRDPDALRYGKLVERELDGEWPDEVVDLRFETGPNSWDEPALRLWAFLSDESTATDELLFKTSRRARAAIRAVLREAVPDRQSYISFRGVSERVEEEAA